nr:MAG TPA: hypothetical protein [Caudoviricetes sp.]
MYFNVKTFTKCCGYSQVINLFINIRYRGE